MKKIIWIFGFLMFSSLLIVAQPVKVQMGEGEVKDLKELTFKYCTMSFGDPDNGKAGWYASIETDKNWMYLVTKTGEKIIFDGKVEMLNYMYQNGWRFVQMILPNIRYTTYLLEKIEK